MFTSLLGNSDLCQWALMRSWLCSCPVPATFFPWTSCMVRAKLHLLTSGFRMGKDQRQCKLKCAFQTFVCPVEGQAGSHVLGATTLSLPQSMWWAHQSPRKLQGKTKSACESAISHCKAPFLQESGLSIPQASPCVKAVLEKTLWGAMETGLPCRTDPCWQMLVWAFLPLHRQWSWNCIHGVGSTLLDFLTLPSHPYPHAQHPFSLYSDEPGPKLSWFSSPTSSSTCTRDENQLSKDPHICLKRQWLLQGMCVLSLLSFHSLNPKNKETMESKLSLRLNLSLYNYQSQSLWVLDGWSRFYPAGLSQYHSSISPCYPSDTAQGRFRRKIPLLFLQP